MRLCLAAAAVTLVAGCNILDADDALEPEGERAAGQGKADGPVVAHKKWTFVFYGAGDNNLGDEIVAAVNQLESVGSTDAVNLIGFYDHPTLGAARVYLETDADPAAIHSVGITQLGAVDSGNPHTLIDTMVWAINTYPADNYALVIDGHGGGSPQIIAPDLTTGHSMSLSDLRQAIDYIHQRTHAPLAVLGGDTCLTQTVEQAVELEDAVDIIAMSQNLDYGWDYTRIAAALVAKPEMTGAELGTEMVEAYKGKYPDMQSLTMQALDTHAALDLEAGMPLLGEALRAYSERSPDTRAAAANLFAQLYRPEYDSDFVDVRHFAALLPTLGDADLTYVAGELDSIARASLVSSFVSANIPNAHGLSVFLPASLTEDTLAAYRVSRFGHESEWDELVAWWHGLQ